ncbi:hypothetical protein RHK62_04915 [Thermosynechococcus sp. HY213]|uniref:hypothetical protein n=1 Tax=Thermosynechococcus sp. HY213 TaxID=3074104 RepID=UPI0028574F9C|nr:hypothetical protein [Thermosynechococcus sp. HY213]MDR7921523.1 hypothetical protein [Thermosynechococcus sp. HY213]
MTTVMHPYDLTLLFLPTVAIFITIAISAMRSGCEPTLAMFLALLKAALYIIYYGFLFDGTFTFLDDWSYLQVGEALLDEQSSLLDLVRSEFVFALAGGDHILYYLYNTVAMDWFGRGYYAPVALNVMATGLIAWLGSRLSVSEGLCYQRYQPQLFAFLVLHPDIVAWSTVMNGKDTLVLLLHVLLLISVAWFLRGRIWHALALGAAASLVLFYLRFYVPFLFSLALLLAVGTRFINSGHKRGKFALLALLMFGVILGLIGFGGFNYVLGELREKFVNPLFGLVRFVLTPIPFNTEEAYAFLDIPAVLHWMLIPAALLGVLKLHRMGTPFSRFLLIYVALFVGLYSIYGELQGPRHRVQLDFAWAIFQFLGLCALLRVQCCPKDLSKSQLAPNKTSTTLW